MVLATDLAVNFVTINQYKAMISNPDANDTVAAPTRRTRHYESPADAATGRASHSDERASRISSAPQGAPLPLFTSRAETLKEVSIVP